MADDQPTEAFSMLFSQRPPIDVVMRGYDRRQVEELLERLEAESAAATADRDAALARSADLAAQLANAYAETESLRRKLRSDTSSVVTAENISDRIRAMLQLAEEEAARMRDEADHYGAQVRRSAEEDRDRIRSEAQAEAERLTAMAAARMAEVEAAYQARVAEGDRYLAEQRALAASESRASRAALEKEIAEAAAERERLDAEHLSERERLDAEHLARRQEADAAAALRRDTATEDFEIALRNRRTAEERTDQERRRASVMQARKTIDDARRQADELLGAAHAELARLATQRGAAIARLREARIAITHTLEMLDADDAAAAAAAPAPERSAVAVAVPDAGDAGNGEGPAADDAAAAGDGILLSDGALASAGEPTDAEIAAALEEGEAADDPSVESDLDRADSTEGEPEDRRSIFPHARGAGTGTSQRA